MADYELYHHGIKGMKWGVRRFQKPDGSLTAMGRARQRLKDRSEKRKAEKAREAENERIQNLMRKPISKLTDAEIAERYARKTKEKQLLDVESQIERISKEPESVIKRFASKAINDVAIPALVDAGKAALTNKIKSTLLDSFGLKNDLKAVEKVVSEYDKVKSERDRWVGLGLIAKNKKEIDEWNSKHPDDQIDYRTGGKKTSTSKPDSKPQEASSSNKSENDSGQTSTSNKPENKPQKMNSTEKTVDADYKETGQQKSQSASTFKPSNSNAKSTHEVFTEMFPGMKNTKSTSVSDLFKSDYRMKNVDAGRSAFNELSRSGWTMRSLDDLEKYS